jgi:hypothetical protein
MNAQAAALLQMASRFRLQSHAAPQPAAPQATGPVRELETPQMALGMGSRS